MASEEQLRDYLRRATVELADTRQRLSSVVERQHEPIAVVGMACRFPGGADTVDGFWELLRDGRSGVTEVPPSRWNIDDYYHPDRSVTGGVYTRHGAFLDDITGWDNEFFGISPQEALRMDPQQRLLMELVWEGLEDAGTPPAAGGSRTAVMAGFMDSVQYGRLQTEWHGEEVVASPFFGQGVAASLVAGRVAYQFDLRGPAVTLDTACSSSLVAVHLAAEALHRDECELAVAAGSFLMMHPDTYVHACATSMLSADGACRTFDAGADGYVMGEGGGVVVLERLSAALRNRRRIRAVLRGSAVNQDGRSNGITAPSRGAQVDVIRRAQAAARVAPEDVDYVEAHGSATRLGDEIELSALQDVFGGRAPERPLRVGAVKTNLGHTHAAAGIAGLIKTVLLLEHGQMPPNLNFQEPSAALPEAGVVEPLTAATPLPEAGRRPIAGVSSFGWSGTNAHVVLEAAPAPGADGAGAPDRPVPAGREVLPVSARNPAALRQQAQRLAAWLTNRPDLDLADVSHTLQAGRAAQEYRRALVCAGREDAVRQLEAVAQAGGGHRAKRRPRVAFLLPGAGSAPVALDASRYRDEPAFADAVAQCAAFASGQLGVDLASPDPGTDTALVALRQFTLGYALAGLLARWGVRPDLLLGYGLGELVAGCLAGVFGLEPALAAVAARARGAGAGPPPDPRQPPAATIVSSHTGGPLAPEAATGPDHWAALPDSPAQLAAAVRYCLAEEVDVFVELGTGPAVGGRVCEQLPADGAAAVLTDLVAEPEQALGQLWELGVPLDWAAVRHRPGRTVSLPTYPFQRTRFWPDPAVPAVASATAPPPDARQANAEVRVLAPQWEMAELAAESAPPGHCVLLAGTAGGAGEVAGPLAEALRADGASVTLLSGVDEELGAALAGAAVTVVDLRLLDRAGVDEDSDPDGRGGVVPLARLFDAAGASGGDVRVVVATRGGQAAVAGAEPLASQAAAAPVAVVAGQEYLNLDCHTVDLDPHGGAVAAAAALAGEVRRWSGAALVAYRGGQRYLPAYPPATPGPEAVPVSVRPGGTYLVTGGLGDLGLLVAEHLVRSGAGRLVLTARRAVPDGPEDLDDPRRAGIARLRALGAEVVAHPADVTDPAAMRAVVASARAGGARLDGVVHAAGDTAAAGFRPLRDLDPPTVNRHFGAKVTGALVLARVLDELPAGEAPDLCLLFGSTSALLGGLTFGGYAAANAALVAVGHRQHARYLAGHTATRWIAAGWDTWAPTLDRIQGGVGAAMAAHSMSAPHALAAFDQLLADPRPSVVVAAGGLDDRLRPAPAATGAAARGGIRYPRPDLPEPYRPPLTDTERILAEQWSEVLGIEPVGTRDNFFDLGGNSLVALQLLGQVKQRFGVAVPTVKLFEAPTVHTLATILDGSGGAAAAGNAPAPQPVRTPAPVRAADRGPEPDLDLDAGADRRIAIVGMAGRFPGAPDTDAFWRNLAAGVESISFFTEDELLASGVPPELARDPSYVPARPVLDDIGGFDAGFFGISPRMAALTDPQQRIFLEVCWEALEQAGYAAPEHRARVGVFGGANLSSYLLQHSTALFGGDAGVSPYEVVMGNDKDALTTTVSYLLDLYGPSVAVQTFCSTSLVAAHLAVQSLRAGECELAIAGGVSVRVPDRVGHRHDPGGMESPDGHVRTFDAQARGSIFGDGAAVVVLKRLGDAVRDGDHIWAVIRGSAMNNDGALKVGFTAPSVVGQARVVADALADAGVTGADISYVEAHGTATELGDPIEVAALTRAFGTPAAQVQYCPIGSVKTNIGHLDRAAGATGLIKTSLALAYRAIPPSLHYTTPNPEIDFAHSPFYVNTDLSPWQAPDGQRRIAGINSLGMGGTNVHMVVEEAPTRPREAPPPESSRRYQVLPVSGRTEAAADQACQRLGAHLQAAPELRLADVAYTLQVGRKTFEHRRALVAAGTPDAAAALAGQDASPVLRRVDPVRGRPVAFLFAGVGEQYPGMVGELYRREPVFRAVLDECLVVLGPQLPGVDLADLLAGERGTGPDLAALLGRGGGDTDADGPDRAGLLERTEIVQPALFAVEYALARTLQAWGVQPRIMLGYSLGEYVAACLAGVMSLADALALVAYRARLIAEVPAGAMVAVSLPVEQLRQRFRLEQRGLDLAAVNGPQMVVVAGAVEPVERFVADLRRHDIPCRRLQTTHAFHSRMLAPHAGELADWVKANVRLHPPQLPYLSNLTGGPAGADLVCDPGYWARHMCATVQFADGVASLLADPELAVVELGPGQSLGALMRGAGCPPQRWPLIMPALPGAGEQRPDDAALTDCLARLWLAGADLDWTAYHHRRPDGEPAGEATLPCRVPLPTYPFQRHRYWYEPPAGSGGTVAVAGPGVTEGGDGTAAGSIAGPTALLDTIASLPKLPEAQWLRLPVWRQTAAAPAAGWPDAWLVYARDEAGQQVAAALREQAAGSGGTVTVVEPGDAYAATAGGYRIRPGSLPDTLALLRDLRAAGRPLERVVHLWTLEPAAGQAARYGLHTVVALARAAAELGAGAWSLDVAVAGTQQVLPGDVSDPEGATLVGPCQVIPLEHPEVTARLVDLPAGTAHRREQVAGLVAELGSRADDRIVALRHGRRWIPGYETMPVPAEVDQSVLREGGVYLVTGGLGGVALGLCARLARACRPRLVLLGRHGLPPREQWPGILDGDPGGSVDEATRRRVAQVAELVALGAEVEIVIGDVARPADARRAVATALDRFGALHGVLHAAGVPGVGLMQFKEPEQLDQVLAPKVAGTLALAQALRIGEPGEVALDFLVLFSSIASATGGGPGQVDYCAANSFLDSFAYQLAGTGRRVLAVDWCEWTWNAWEDGLAGFDESVQRFFRENRERVGLGFDEGWRALLRALASREPRVVVSTQDFQALVDGATRFTVAAMTSPPAAAGGGQRHPRPELVTPYQEPAGELEEAVAAMWRDALRLERVGVQDSFFELGGNSLLGVNLVAALRREFALAELPPHVLYEAPTVAALAQTIETARSADGGPAAAPDGASQVRAQLRRSGVEASAAARRRGRGPDRAGQQNDSGTEEES